MLAHPEMLGQDLLVVTSECDRWSSVRGRERDRLDVLALDRDGHLVVVELKRDPAPETVEVQALKYAAFCSRFTPDTLASEHAAWRTRCGDPLDDEAARARLEAHLSEDVGGLVNAPLKEPRIVLLAGGFSPSTTAVAVWLREMGVEITLRTIRAYRTEHGPVVSVSALYPTPAVEEFTVSPLLAERRRDEQVRRAGRRERAVAQIIAAGTLTAGQALTVRAAGPDAARFARWAETGQRDQVTWTGQASRPLRWVADEAAEADVPDASVTAMVVRLYELAEAGVPGGAATGLVVTEDGISLAELAGTGIGAGFDWTGLHRLLERVEPGRWATSAPPPP